MEVRRASPSLIGREDELDALSSALERARAGEASLVLLAGTAGAGKTRLVREWAASADARVLVGGCLDLGEGALPFAPLVEALRRLRGDLGRDRLRALAANDAAELTRLVPGLLGDAASVGHPMDRGLLFESLLAFLDRLAAERPLVLAFEDLHWADRSTLDLLAFLARNLHDQQVLMLGTFRTDDLTRTHPLRPWLAELTRLSTAQRLDLRPLDRDQVMELLTAILGESPDGSFVESVVDRSEGNPFYAEELLAARSSGAAIPPSLHDVLAARVAEVAPAARAVLRVASAAGREMDHALLARVAQMPDTELLDGLREAVASQVLITDSDGTAYRFRHALLQEVAYSELLPGERVALHGRIAQVLEEHPHLAAGGAELAAGELAHHWAAARDVPRAFTSSLDAARSAEEHYAFAEALVHLERALELWDLVPEGLHEPVPPRHDVLSTASDMARHASQHRRSIDHALAALEQAEQADASPAVIATLLRRLSYLSWLGGDTEQGAQILGRALEAAGDEPTLEVAQVLGWRSRFLVLTNRPREAIDAGERAVELARQLGAPKEEGYALNSLAVAHALLDELDRGLPMLREARRLALEAAAVEDVAVAFNNEITLLLMAGRHADAVAATAEARSWAEDAGIRGGVVVSITLNGVDGLVRLGRYDEAEQLLAVTPLPHEDPISRYDHRLQSAWVRLSRGDLDAARAHATEAYDIVVGRSDLQLVPVTSAVLGYLDRLQARHEDGLGRIETALRCDGGWVTSSEPYLALRVHALLAAERARAARDRDDQATVHDSLTRLDRLLERARAQATAEPHGHARQSLEQAIRQAVAERGWIVGEPDADAWREAVVAFPDGSPLFDVLVAQGRLAEALVAAGDRDDASAVLASALARAVEVGARQLETELGGLARRFRLSVEGGAGSAGDEGAADGFGLTAREQEVLRLLAEGNTNRQIGEALYISSKTASVHVSNILGKLGVENRGEAAALAHRAGLTTG